MTLSDYILENLQLKSELDASKSAYTYLAERYDMRFRENAALKKLLERAHERLDELKQGSSK